MLTFEEKKAVFDSFPELTAAPVSLKRLNYHFEDSAVAKTTVVRFLHPNGNAFVYAGYLPAEETDKGYISVMDATETELRELVEKAINHLRKTENGYEVDYQETWTDQRGAKLTLQYDHPMWVIYVPNGQLEGVFKSKDAAEGYLMDEGFYQN